MPSGKERTQISCPGTVKQYLDQNCSTTSLDLVPALQLIKTVFPVKPGFTEIHIIPVWDNF